MTQSAAVDLDALAAERWYADRGRRPVAAERLDRLGPLELVRVAFEQGEPALYTLLRDEPRWDEVFAAADGAFATSGEAPRGPTARLEVDQSHTSWRVGDALVKCYRRLVPGAHPEIELGRALTAELPEHVAAVRGTLRWEPDGSEPVAVAVVHEFVDGAEEGWEWAAGRAADGDAGFAREVGVVARRLHDALARAFPTRPYDAGDGAAWRRAAEEQLDEALALAPELRPLEERIRAELAALERGGHGVLGRIHGDLHVGQYLHAPSRTVVVDFEGQPGRPLAARRALDTPLRDVASLARSVDHCGRYAARSQGVDPDRVDAWILAARSELLAGYGEHDATLLRALEVERAVYEFTYAARYLPEWLYAPRAGLAALLDS